MTPKMLWDAPIKEECAEDGETKTLWFRAGAIKTTARGKRYLQLHQHPDIDSFIAEPLDDEYEIIEA